MNLKRILSPVLGIGVVLGSLTGIVSPVSAQGSGAITIQNPYTGVDWGTWGQYKAANHTHSTYSDGSNKREDVLRDKYNKGFDIVAMTDHDVLTNKWDEAPEHNNPHPTTPTWRDNIGAGVLTSDALAAINAGTYYNSNFQGQYAGERTKTNGMIGMGGSNEWSAFNEPNITLTAGGTANFSGHHINTFFANLPQSAIADGSRTLANIIKGAQDLGGLAHINHPGRYTGGQTNEARSSDPDIVKAYVDLYTEYPSLVGMEIINKWDGESVNDRILWDNILMQTMPDRGVWGFTNDDSHSLSGNGHAWNVMLMPALTTDNTKTAMKDGAFYGVTRIERKYKINDEGTPGAPAQTTTTAAQYSGGDHNNMALGFLAQGALPSISNIVVDETAGTIVISAANSTNIDWVADGEVIYTGTSIDVNDYSTEINNYVRAVVVGPTGVAYTQPFGVASGKITLNPYDGVNWSTWGQYKAAHHMHSTYSDGSNRRRDQLIDMYNKDFDIVAMTDHDVLTEKWDEEPQHNNPHPTTSSWRDNIGAGVLTAAEAAAINGGTYQRGEYFQGQYLGRRVQTNGMIGMGGSNEWSAFDEPNINLTAGGTASFSGHHINTFFANLPQSAIDAGSRTLANIIKKAEDLGGLAHINHPGRYTGGQTNEARSSDPDIVKAYVDLYTEYPSLVGMEIINKWDGESVNDRILWDNILMKTMPEGRGVWGFTNDDSHSLSGNGHAWNVMLMPELTQNATKTAMKNGAFYGVTRIERQYSINGDFTGSTPGAPAQTTTTADQYSGGTHNDMALGFLAQTKVPSISNIAVNQTNGTIAITAADFDKIEWVADGEVIHTGTNIDINEYTTKINSYVRAVIIGEEGVAYTQPFGVSKSTTNSILSNNRIIPTVPTPGKEDVAAAALSGELTVGPNPTAKSSGTVSFFRQGKRIKDAKLTIYDASGNVVNKVKINDKTVDSQSRRTVGSWNLKDMKGRPAAEGTYLVKGVVTTSDGNKEKVSLMIGVQ